MHDETTKQSVIDKLRTGLIAPVVSEQTGICVHTVRRWGKAAGLVFPRGAAMKIAYATGRRPKEAQSAFRRTHALDEDAFSTAITPAKAWALGVIAGDGCVVEDRGVIAAIDVVGTEGVCRKIASILRSDSDPVCKGGWWQIRFHSPKLAVSTAQFGIHPRKSYSVAFPELATALVPHFMRGFWDADGCWTWKTTRGVRYPQGALRSASNKIMSGFLEHARLPTGTNQSLIECKDNTWMFSVSCRKAVALGNWLYADSDDSIRCERKFGRWQEIVNG